MAVLDVADGKFQFSYLQAGSIIKFYYSVKLTGSQGWKLMLFKRKDESMSIIHTKRKELSTIDIRNKKQIFK